MPSLQKRSSAGTAKTRARNDSRNTSGKVRKPQEVALTKEDYETLANFRYAIRRFLQFSKERARAVGLQPQQHQALLAIMGMPGRMEATVGEIAERLQIEHHSAVGLVQRLEAQGYASRRRDSKDRRQVIVSVTESGHDLLEVLSKAHREEIVRIGHELAEPIRRLTLEIRQADALRDAGGAEQNAKDGSVDASRSSRSRPQAARGRIR